MMTLDHGKSLNINIALQQSADMINGPVQR